LPFNAGALKDIGAALTGAIAFERGFVVENCASDREAVCTASDVFAGMPLLER
jgi:hypothetical protein